MNYCIIYITFWFMQDCNQLLHKCFLLSLRPRNKLLQRRWRDFKFLVSGESNESDVFFGSVSCDAQSVAHTFMLQRMASLWHAQFFSTNANIREGGVLALFYPLSLFLSSPYYWSAFDQSRRPWSPTIHCRSETSQCEVFSSSLLHWILSENRLTWSAHLSAAAASRPPAGENNNSSSCFLFPHVELHTWEASHVYKTMKQLGSICEAQTTTSGGQTVKSSRFRCEVLEGFLKDILLWF